MFILPLLSLYILLHASLNMKVLLLLIQEPSNHDSCVFIPAG